MTRVHLLSFLSLLEFSALFSLFGACIARCVGVSHARVMCAAADVAGSIR
jgi:hypothetical protein